MPYEPSAACTSTRHCFIKNTVERVSVLKNRAQQTRRLNTNLGITTKIDYQKTNPQICLQSSALLCSVLQHWYSFNCVFNKTVSCRCAGPRWARMASTPMKHWWNVSSNPLYLFPFDKIKTRGSSPSTFIFLCYNGKSIGTCKTQTIF